MENPSHLRGPLSRAFLLQLSFGSFSAVSLASETGKTYGYCSSLLKSLKSKGLVTKVSESAVLGSGGRSGLRGLSASRFRLTRKGRTWFRVVLSGGVFDIIHPGHVSFLEQARSLGDVLVVSLARDSTARKSGKAPINPEGDRLKVLSSLRHADLALLGSEKTRSETVRKVSPDLVCLGYDQASGWLNPLKKTLGFEITRLEKTGEHSTTSIMDRINTAGTNINP